jgi:hypothetical protein
MYLNFEDILRLIHPTLAVTVVFPIIGITVFMAVQTRQRRLQADAVGKSKISPLVGPEHVKVGRLLAVAVVAIELLGITRPMFKKISEVQLWSSDPTKFFLILLMYGVTIGSLICLIRARQPIWRGVFATLSGAALVVLSLQDGIFRRDEEWYLSHLYIGILVTLLMIFSLAIIPDIYQDRRNRWRTVHIIVNCVALVLFFLQGFTGTRDLLEIPLSWQGPALQNCDFANKKCT